MKAFLVLVLLFSISEKLDNGFLDEQKKYTRVREAIGSKDSLLVSGLGGMGLKKEAFEMLLLVFKSEGKLEIHLRRKGSDSAYRLFRTYEICASSGSEGPKETSGDGQVPEGFYRIDRFNPVSSFHLSLGVNYPNTADIRRAAGRDPGGDIFIHGNCVTVGCVPITDDKIKEVYLLAVYARNAGQLQIPVYFFPYRMEDAVHTRQLEKFASNTPLVEFWKSLKPGYDQWMRNGKPVSFGYGKGGLYTFN